ncbi:MAG: hypothetical protein NC924_01425 [Candidatus Omnitrophica bacterium]|nr:hypothetical protein [Candidatus Omnitrophota bacterium]
MKQFSFRTRTLSFGAAQNRLLAYGVLFFVSVAVVWLVHIPSAEPQAGGTLIMQSLYPTPLGEYREIVTRRWTDSDNPAQYVDIDTRAVLTSINVAGSPSKHNGQIGNLTVSMANVPGEGIRSSNPATPSCRIDLSSNGYMELHSVMTESRITMGAASAVNPHTEPRLDNSNLPGKHVYDVAEGMSCVTGGAGDVVIVSPEKNNTLEIVREAYSSKIAGVISTNPRLYMGPGEDVQPLALVGIVLCNVSAENGPIRRGDLLVSAAAPGHAMRAELSRVSAGMVVGKALQSFDAGQGQIYILVNKQ